MNFVLYLVLAAAPTAATPPVPPASPAADPMNAVYLLVGALVLKELVSLGRDFIKGLATRTVQKEDADKEEIKKKVKEVEERIDETDDSLEKVDRLVGNVQTELKQVLQALEGTKATVNEIRNTMELNRDKQAQAHREAIKEQAMEFEKKLKDLEYKLRQDMSRAAHDAVAIGDARGRKKTS